MCSAHGVMCRGRPKGSSLRRLYLPPKRIQLDCLDMGGGDASGLPVLWLLLLLPLLPGALRSLSIERFSGDVARAVDIDVDSAAVAAADGLVLPVLVLLVLVWRHEA